jgi:hydrogenase nickel incorporation protein HypA/HybF
MHELSIAQSILKLARSHVPPGSRLCAVRVSAGPMRGIDPQCLQAAFNALNSSDGVDFPSPDKAAPRAAAVSSEIRLDLVELPWSMHCDECGRTWTSQELDSRCPCGSSRVRPTGGDDLELLSIEIDPVLPRRSAS